MASNTNLDPFQRLTVGDWRHISSFDALVKSGEIVQDANYKSFFRDKQGNTYTCGALQRACWQARHARRRANTR